MPIFLLVIAGAAALQYRLAKLPRRWPGRVLPLLCFLFSLIFCAWLAFFSQPREEYVVRTTDGLYHHFETAQDAERFMEKVPEVLEYTHPTPTLPPGAFALGLAGSFVGINLFTLLLVIMNARIRRKKSRFLP